MKKQENEKKEKTTSGRSLKDPQKETVFSN